MLFGITIISDRPVVANRPNRSVWQVGFDDATAFVAVPLRSSGRGPNLSERMVDAILHDAAAENRPELVLNGWMVQAHGRAWKQPALVACLRQTLVRPHPYALPEGALLHPGAMVGQPVASTIR
ncbi:MAG: hypothetical protein QME77_12765 [bacterium]|nr:hypothetical protein [bacterium]